MKFVFDCKLNIITMMSKNEYIINKQLTQREIICVIFLYFVSLLLRYKIKAEWRRGVVLRRRAVVLWRRAVVLWRRDVV